MIRIISFNITIIFSFRAVLKVAAIVKWLNYISSKLSTGTLENGKQIFAKPRFEYPSDKIKFPKILLKISLIATNQIFMKRSTQPSRRYFMQILSLPFVNKPCSRFNLTLVEGRRPLALRPSVKTLTLFIKNGRRRPANLFPRGWRPSLWLVSVVAIANFRSTQASATQAEGEGDGSRAKIIIGEFRRWKIYRPCLPSSFLRRIPYFL